MITLYNGDCLEEMKNIPDKSIDLILTDLPYGNTSCKWDSAIDMGELWSHWKRILKDRGQVLLFGIEPFMSTLITSNLKEYSHQWYWKRSNVTGNLNAKKEPMRCIEEIAVFRCNRKKGVNHFTYNPQGIHVLEKVKKRKGFDRNVYGVSYGYTQTVGGYPKHILEYNSPPLNNRLHACQKPTDLLEYLVKTYSNEGETVLDCTMGSGSTGVACIHANRKFIGIEKDDKIFEIASKRLEGEIALQKEKSSETDQLSDMGTDS